MKVTIVGTGYVGLVSGTCLAEIGHHVTCIDIDSEKIASLNQGVAPIYEPGLEDYIQKNIKEKRLTFSTELKTHVSNSEIVLIAVGTPQDEVTGQADLTAVMACATDIIKAANTSLILVTKSTVPINTHLKLADLAHSLNPDLSIDIVSNPEFLREGSAVYDFMNPDRIIIGVGSSLAQEKMQTLYQPFADKGSPLVFTTPASAELIKYASNCFLATKIAFINEMADLCEKTGAEIDQVAQAMGIDKRIGADFLKTGPGYGGSCFPKDTHALVYSARNLGAPLSVVESVIASNTHRKEKMAERVIHHTSAHNCKKISLLGVAFKAETDDIRESPAINIIEKLLDSGYSLNIYDPQALSNAKKMFKSPSIKWCTTSYEALEQADAAVIITEWQEFKDLNPVNVAALLKTPLVIDLRNIIKEEAALSAGLHYIPLGKKPASSSLPLSSLHD